MERIEILHESVKNKIAAGEVIEGPFSVVKELMENSMDAGAGRVEVQIEDAGMKRVSVKDDGRGIAAADIRLAVVEHATSKIRGAEDIERIASYGFRGEALSSIAAVSDVTILSRRGEEPIGARLTARAGDVSVQDFAGPRGTTVIADNLFYTVPARKKFMKSRGAELRYIRESFLRTALPHIGAEFTLDVDGRRVFTISKALSLEERIGALYAIEMEQSMISDSIQDLKVTLRGFFSRPHFMKTNRSLQMLYVNGRPVDYKYLGMHVSRAYEGVAVKGQYPAVFLFVEIDPSLVDVNIHPAKREVKIFDQRYLDGLIHSLLRKGLSGQQRMADRLFREPGGTEDRIPAAVRNEFELFTENTGTAAVRDTAPMGPARSIVKEMKDLYEPGRGRNYSVLGVAFGTYCIIQIEESLHFIDLHAAHERVIYDSLMSRDRRSEVQELLFPRVMHLPVDEHRIVMENLEPLERMGFAVEDFSDSSIIIRAVPEIADGVRAEDVVAQFIQSVKEERDHVPAENLIAASVACHSARRSGDSMTHGELVELVDRALDERRELRCPHGRPFLYKIDKNDLERIFKRQ